MAFKGPEGVETGNLTLEVVHLVPLRPGSSQPGDSASAPEEESEIAESMVQVIENERILIEGSAAVSVAGYQKIAHRFTSESVVVVLSGANLSRGTLLDVLSTHRPGVT